VAGAAASGEEDVQGRRRHEVAVRALVDGRPGPLRAAAEHPPLKETYASNAIKAVGVQLAIADGVFIFYAIKHGIGSVPAPVMESWLGATVVQVVGVVLVITRSLFPSRTETIKTEHKA